MKKAPKGISILICCCNSTWVIEKTLDYILRLVIPKDLNGKVEVVLVDNNSTDGTSNFVKDFWDKNGTFPLHLYREDKQGLSYARARAIMESNFEYLIFCDDDNFLDQNYIIQAFNVLNSNSKIGIVGGHNIGKLEIEQPSWWKDKAHGYAVGVQAKSSGDITNRGYVWGAGSVVRRSILITLFKAGFSSLLIGREGSKLSSGDDFELCQWAIIMGYKLWYDENLKLQHYIRRERLTEDYVQEMINGHIQSHKLLKGYIFFNSNKHILEKNCFYQVFYSLKRMLISLIVKIDINNFNSYLQLLLGKRILVTPSIQKILKIYSNLKLNDS